MEVQEPQHYTCTLCDHRVAVEVYWCVLNSRYNYKIISNRISAALQSNLSLSFSLSVSVFYLSPHSPPSLSVFVTFSVPPSLILFLSVSPCHSAFILTVHPLTLQQFVILHSTHPGGHKYGCGKIWSVCSGSEMVCVCVCLRLLCLALFLLQSPGVIHHVQLGSLPLPVCLYSIK